MPSSDEPERILPCPSIAISDGRPYSERFSDIYHPAEAVAAARAVFVDGNRLGERFADARGCFVIAELGFGLGINFLAAVDLWRTVAPGQARLHYIGVEAFPPAAAQIKAAHAAVGCDPATTGWLCGLLPPRWPGWHHVDCGGGIALSLIYQDALSALADADFAADAWFLDGFAPDCNPRMWDARLLAEVARLTAAGGSCATYSSAGQVRRNLADAGFSVRRQAGFAHKREMLCGRKPGRRIASRRPAKVLVIGAGIAGRCVARSLQRRAVGVQLIASNIRHSASTVPRLLQTPRVTPSLAAHSRLSLACFAYAQAQALQAGGRQCGALLLAGNDAQRARHDRIRRHRWPDSLIVPMDAAAASDCAGVTLERDALWLPQAVSAVSADVFARLPEARFIDDQIVRLEDSDAGVTAVSGSGQRFCADAVVLCCADAAADLAADLRFDFSLHSGVAIKLRRRAGARTPKAALLYGHILNPDCRASGDWLCASDCDLAADGDRQGRIEAYLPQSLAGNYRVCPETLWQGTRAALADRMPALGRAGKRVYMLAGLGARGHALAFLLAEALAAQMTDEPVPLPVSLRRASDPARFADLRRQFPVGAAKASASA